METTAMLDAALDYISKGWQVLPCWATNTITRPNRAKSPIGRLVPNGFHDATQDPKLVRAWWSRQPDALIGVVVDPRLAIIDIDPRNGGSAAAIEHLTRCTITATRTVWLGRLDGGRHLYYWRPDEVLSARRLPAGIDLKVSGYVIAPPSLHPATGMPYSWDDQQVARMPNGLTNLLSTPEFTRSRFQRHGRTLPANPSGLVEFVARQKLGNVNNGLHWAACRAVEHDLLDERLVEGLVAAAVHAGESERQARRTVDSATSTAVTR